MRLIDLHAHILPGADHGSSSVETSLAQLSYAAAAGVDAVVATPHFYAHHNSLDAFLQRREHAYARLCVAMQQHTGLPEVRLGAEVLLFPGIERLEGLEQLCLSGTHTLLLELPMHAFQSVYAETAKSLVQHGFQVLLAHADRYPRQSVEAMLRAGVCLQLNATSVMNHGFFARRRYLSWARLGYVVGLGSDIHGEDAAAYSILRDAYLTGLGMHAEAVSAAAVALWERLAAPAVLQSSSTATRL